MTIEEAKKILHPDTSREAIAEINEQNGFDREKGIEKVKEACLVACEVMDKYSEIIHCKDCKHWGFEFMGGETDHVKCCYFGHYMVGENGYCVYGEKEN